MPSEASEPSPTHNPSQHRSRKLLSPLISPRLFSPTSPSFSKASDEDNRKGSQSTVSSTGTESASHHYGHFDPKDGQSKEKAESKSSKSVFKKIFGRDARAEHVEHVKPTNWADDDWW